MDPDEALRKCRAVLPQLRIDAKDPEPADVRQLVKHFEALDDWLVQGGFLPAAWRP